ncbi:MAG TPA: hypothetical protein VM577_03915, partial [Anaerovoracaceae bacterium]|nr:hypothetical protein [Anaerovoracaceae bacterium]
MNAQSKSLSDALVFPDEQTIQHYLSQSKTTISYSEEDKIDILDAAVSYGTCEQLEYLLNNHSFSQDLISTAACWACAVSVEKVKLIVEHAPQAAEDLKTGLLNAIN